jgi:hypothetical protein
MVKNHSCLSALIYGVFLTDRVCLFQFGIDNLIETIISEYSSGMFQTVSRGDQ